MLSSILDDVIASSGIIAVFASCATLCWIPFLQFSSPSMSRKAYHEAGHVVVAMHLGIPIDYVRIDESNVDNHVTMPSDFKVTAENAEDVIKIAVAGVLSTEIFFRGKHKDSGFSDMLAAKKAYTDYVQNSGYQRTEEQYLMATKAEVRNILLSRMDKIDMVAQALLNERRLEHGQISDMFMMEHA